MSMAPSTRLASPCLYPVALTSAAFGCPHCCRSFLRSRAWAQGLSARAVVFPSVHAWAHGEGVRTACSRDVDDAQAEPRFKKIACGAYHMLAIDLKDRLWTWGRGQMGVLGHGDTVTAYTPKLVEALRYHICNDVVGGGLHSAPRAKAGQSRGAAGPAVRG